MTDTTSQLEHDDAPLTASKRSDAVDEATASMIEDRGDTLFSKAAA